MAAAAAGAAGSVLGGVLAGKGATKAARIQAQSYQQGLAQQQAQFNTTQQNISPFLQSGQSALGATGDLLGLNGTGVQGSAIDALKASPLFQSQYNTGLDAILQGAAATGGLRGGNVALAQSGFGSSLLASVIQNQLGNLGGLINTGANAASGLASAGQSNANATSSLLQGLGNAQAGGVLGGATAASRTANDLGSILQTYLANRQPNGGSSNFQLDQRLRW